MKLIAKKVINFKAVDNDDETSSNLYVAVTRDEGRRESQSPYGGSNQRNSPRRADEIQEYKQENERLRHRNADFVIPIKEEALYYSTLLFSFTTLITWVVCSFLYK